MARGKKAAKELSPEEKLQQALVPAEEWPYPIPENWCWVRLGSLCTDIQYGYTAKAIFDNNYPKMLRITDIQGGEVDWDNVPNCEITENDFKKYELVSHDIVFARTGATTGKSCFVLEPPKSVYASYLIRIRLNSSFNKKYVYYILQSEVYWKQIMELSSGIAQPGVNAAKLQSLLCPLSPLSEQQRIVDRIESLFAKLDEAKEKAQAVVDGFELRKSAILHKAFTGELTERWRKEHGVGLESWTETTIGEQAELITKGASPRWQGVEYTDDKSQTLFVTSENVREGYLNFTKEKYLSNKINDIQKRSILNYGDVLVNIVGASIGRAAIYNLHQLANTNQAVCIVRLKPGISNEFVCTYLNAPIAQSYYYDNKVETARANISLGSISAMYINLPTSAEQKEIVDTLNMALEMEQQAKEAAEAVLSQIDTMKKAILARAFRGELGTNNPKEEWAGTLLNKLS